MIQRLSVAIRDPSRRGGAFSQNPVSQNPVSQNFSSGFTEKGESRVRIWLQCCQILHKFNSDSDKKV
jgi:hypothetical protein